jgi:hypothetical protein
MMMKRSKAFVPATQTGDAAGDGRGQGIGWVNKGGRNATTDQSRRGAGQLAPRPQNSKQPLLGSSKHTGPTTAGMARVQDRPSSAPRGTSGAANAGSFTPVQNNALANLTGQATGQSEVMPRGNSSRIGPQTRMPVTGNPTATKKPRTRAALAFYGE